MASGRAMRAVCVAVIAFMLATAPAVEAKKKHTAVVARIRQHFAGGPAPAPMMMTMPLNMPTTGRSLLQDAGAPADQDAAAPQSGEATAPSADQNAAAPAADQNASAPAPPAATEPTEEQAAMAGAPSPGGAMDASQPAAPWGQCGGTSASDSGMQPWKGSTFCGANHTCVVISPQFSQCVPVTQSRGYGCSAKYAQCGGMDAGSAETAWSGPYCCQDEFPVECVYFSNSFSQCKPCNAAWEQCGGLVPGTSTPWTSAARPGCCAKGSMCKYVSSSFYQCQPV